MHMKTITMNEVFERLVTIAAATNGGALKKIFVLLRAQTGHDFSQYKPSTIHRRIERRMAVHQIDSVQSYIKYLQQTPPVIPEINAA